MDNDEMNNDEVLAVSLPEGLSAEFVDTDIEVEEEPAFTFEKVSWETYLNDWKSLYGKEINKTKLKEIYDNIQLPERSTRGSAGFDFHTPFGFTLKMGSNIMIPTGIRFVANRKDIVCLLVPRSSLGVKYGIRLLNTVGVIDSDYQYSDNEGHIFVDLHMDGKKLPLKMEFHGDELYTREELEIFSSTTISIKPNDRICQGLVHQYLTDANKVTAMRNGGHGSTGK